MWVDVLGRQVVRPGVPETFDLVYGNSGNQDATLVPVVITGIPGDATVVFNFNIAPGAGTVSTPQAPELLYLPNDNTYVAPLMLPAVPANSIEHLTFTIQIPQAEALTLTAILSPPWIDSVNISAYSCIEDWYENLVSAGSIIPGQTGVFLTFLSCANSVADQTSKAAFGAMFNHIYGGGNQIISLHDYVAKLGLACVSVPISKVSGVLGELFQNSAQLANEFEELAANSLIAEKKLTNIRAAEEQAQLATEYSLHKENADLLNILITGGGLAASTPQTISDCQQGFGTKGKASRSATGAQSIDPNAKAGPQGFGPAAWVSGLIGQPFAYSVSFANEASATAPAQTVVVTDPIDTTKFDPSTFAFGPITLPQQTVIPPAGTQNYATTVDLRPGTDLLVRIEANLNTSTGLRLGQSPRLTPARDYHPQTQLSAFYRLTQALPTARAVSPTASNPWPVFPVIPSSPIPRRLYSIETHQSLLKRGVTRSTPYLLLATLTHYRQRKARRASS